MPNPQSARAAVNMICTDAKGAADKLPKMLSVPAKNEIEKACRELRSKLAKAERWTKDAESVAVTASFANVSPETWAEIKAIVTEEAKRRSSKDPSQAPTPVDVKSLVKGSGKQRAFKLPVRVDRTEIHLLLNYELDFRRPQVDVHGAGAQISHRTKDGVDLKGAFLVNKTGEVGAYVTVGLTF